MKPFLILITAFLCACSGNDSADVPTTPIVDVSDNEGSSVDDDSMDSMDEDGENPDVGSPDPVDPEPALEATYQVTFKSEWTESDHLGLPSNAHFSPIVLTVHSSSYRLFPIGERASSGFERVAETGNATDLNSEVRAQIRRGRVLSSFNTDDMFLRDTSSQTFKITVTRTNSLVSFVTMIAPSPDWVVGLDSLDLLDNDGSFLSSIERDLFAYDGGTEEGDVGGNFSIRNRSTSPRERISRLRGRGFDKPFASVDFVKID